MKPVFSEAFNTEMSVQARCFSLKPVEFRGLIAEILVEARLFWGPSLKPVESEAFTEDRFEYMFLALKGYLICHKRVGPYDALYTKTEI